MAQVLLRNFDDLAVYFTLHYFLNARVTHHFAQNASISSANDKNLVGKEFGTAKGKT